MTPDPSGLYYADPENPQSLNLYSYVLNNPLINVDPDGMECVWDDGSFDSKDDKQTGNSAGCKRQGGTWVDPKAFSTLNAGDWSDKANSTIAGIAQDLNSTSTTIVVSAQNQQIDPDDARINTLVQGVAQDTAGLPWLCNISFSIKAQIPKTPIQLGVSVDKTGVHGSAGFRAQDKSTGQQVGVSTNGKKTSAQISVPIPDTPFRATVGLGGAHPTVGVSTGFPMGKTMGQSNQMSASVSLSFGYLGDVGC